MDAVKHAVARCLLFFASAFVLICGGIFGFSPTPTEAAVTSVFTYQARITDSSGNPIADGNYSMKFSLYSAASGGTPIWTAAGTTASPSAITVHATSSLVTVYLGDAAAGQNTLSGIDWDTANLYLGVTIGSDSEMAPRRRLTAVPQAFRADTAGSADRLQGMYASSTASSGESLFTIHQTTNDAATSIRTALEVRSRGTSNEFDYLIRGVNSDGTTVFSINRGGAVTSTSIAASGLIQAGSVSSTTVTATNITGVTVTATTLHVGTVNADAITGGSASFSGGVSFLSPIDSGLGTSMGITSLGGVTTSRAVSSTRMQLVGDILFIQGTSTISVVNVGDPSAPTELDSIEMPGRIGGFTAQGKYLYIVYEYGLSRELVIYDYSVPSALSSVAYIPLAPLTQVDDGVDVIALGQVLYVIGNYDQVIITVDIRNPLAMLIRNQTLLPQRPVRTRLEGHYLVSAAVYGTESYVYRVDVSDAFNPGSAVDSGDIGNGAQDLFIRGRTAYVPLSTAGQVAVIDLSSALPRVVARLTGVTGASRVFDNGGRLFVYAVGLNGYRVYNTASSTNPTLIGASIVSGNIRSFEQYGSTLIYGTDQAPYINFIRLPGITVNSLQGGTGTFEFLGAAAKLQVGGDAVIDNSLSVGMGGLYVGGSARIAGYGTTSSALSAVNQAPASDQKSWGIYTNRLLVGEEASATGTSAYVSLFAYNSANSRNGVCLDNLNTASTCANFGGTVYSLLADDAVGANAFDLAERYDITGEAEPGDVLVLDPETPLHMKKSTGVEYDPALSGVVSTRPGFLLGTGGDVSVALAGRVPVKVTIANGAIAVGDLLTSSAEPGRAMKATRAGKILGRALEATTADGVIEVYLQPGFDATSLLQADGTMTTIAQNIGVRPEGIANAATPSFDSRVLSFLGSAWDGSLAQVSEFRLFNDVRSSTNSLLTVASPSSSLFTIDQRGSVELAQDLVVGGKLYPSARGQAQRESYLFLDDTEEGARYISTNADGWQSMDGYDYAERYASPDKLEPGDVVSVRRGGRVYVQRSLNETDMAIGIVSTKPGFIAGRPQDDAYPIALAGRVPTNVSSINGAIQAGDALAPSTIPGVAVKATRPGPIVGIALEDFAGNDVSKIEVFVNPGWWGGDTTETASAVSGLTKQGFAQIVMGATKVRVHFTGFIKYPNIQVTPYTQIESGWWIDNVGPEGFDIVLGAPVGRQARFAWTAQEVANDPTVTLSSGMVFALDPVTGAIQYPPGADETTRPRAPVPELVEKTPEEESGVQEDPEADQGTVSAGAEPVVPPTQEAATPEPEGSAAVPTLETEAPATPAAEPVLPPEPAPEPAAESSPSSENGSP